MCETGKTCSRCLIEKNLDEFPADQSKADGRYPRCRSCLRELYAERSGQPAHRVKLIGVEHPGVTTYRQSLRRAREFGPSLSLTDDEKWAMRTFYALAAKLGRVRGPHNVDHRIALSKGGQHHPTNLQVLSRADHREKTRLERFA